jgi:hypothetical protein
MKRKDKPIVKKIVKPNFNGPKKNSLAWLWTEDGLKSFPPHKTELHRVPNVEWAKKYGQGNQTAIVICGTNEVGIVLTEEGWYLEDRGGG